MFCHKYHTHHKSKAQDQHLASIQIVDVLYYITDYVVLESNLLSSLKNRVDCQQWTQSESKKIHISLAVAYKLIIFILIDKLHWNKSFFLPPVKTRFLQKSWFSQKNDFKSNIFYLPLFSSIEWVYIYSPVYCLSCINCAILVCLYGVFTH